MILLKSRPKLLPLCWMHVQMLILKHSLTVLNKMFVIIAGIHKMLIRIANRKDPDQTASSEAV